MSSDLVSVISKTIGDFVGRYEPIYIGWDEHNQHYHLYLELNGLYKVVYKNETNGRTKIVRMNENSVKIFFKHFFKFEFENRTEFLSIECNMLVFDYEDEETPYNNFLECLEFQKGFYN